MEGAEKLQKWPQKSFKRPQKPSKKASGEATGDHGGSIRLKEGLLDTKKRPRRPAGEQDFSKKPFWYHFGFHFGSLFWLIFGFQNRVQIWVRFWSRFLLRFGPKKLPILAQKAFNVALEGPKKRQDELQDAMHQKIQRSIETLQTCCKLQ